MEGHPPEANGDENGQQPTLNQLRLDAIRTMLQGNRQNSLVIMAYIAGIASPEEREAFVRQMTFHGQYGEDLGRQLDKPLLHAQLTEVADPIAGKRLARRALFSYFFAASAVKNKEGERDVFDAGALQRDLVTAKELRDRKEWLKKNPDWVEYVKKWHREM